MYDRLGDLLPQALGRLRLRKTVDAARVCATVNGVLGELWDHAVSMRAIIYRHGVVTVAVTSAGWSHEVASRGEDIKAAVNKKLGTGAVNTLKVRVSPASARGADT